MLNRYIVTLLALIALINHQVAQIQIIATNTAKHIVDLSVLKNNVIVVGREDYMSKSSDGANSLAPCPLPGPVGYQNHLCRIDTSTQYLLSESFPNYNNKIYKSIDGGINWSLKIDTSGLSLTFMCFFDSLEGVAFSTFGKQIRTKNAGLGWSPSVSGNLPSLITDVTVFGDSTIVVSGVDGPTGSIYISNDRGNSWPLGWGYANSQPTGLFFLNKDTIFGISCCGGSNTSYPEAYFTKSFNGGATWKNITLDRYSRFRSLFFKNKNEGYLVGQNLQQQAIILKTSNMGATWETFNTHLSAQLYDIKFLNDSVALVAGTNGLLFKWNTKQTIFTGIEENSFGSGLKIFPNPVNDKLSFQFDKTSTQDITLEISNTLGQIVYSKVNVDLQAELNVAFLKSGLYYLELKNKTSKKVFKFVKE